MPTEGENQQREKALSLAPLHQSPRILFLGTLSASSLDGEGWVPT